MADRTDQTIRFVQAIQGPMPEQILLSRAATSTGDIVTVQASSRGISTTFYLRQVPTPVLPNELLGIDYNEPTIIAASTSAGK